MLKRFFQKDFTNENFLEELLLTNPKLKWLEEALTQPSININKVDEKGNTPLMTTLIKASYRSAIWLIKHGADTTIRNKENKLPIDIAVHKDKIQIVEELLKLKKLNLNQKDEYGRSLLQNIVITGNLDMAETLIKCGANINNIDSKGKHILYDALSYGDPVFVRRLLTYKNIELNDIDKDGNTLMQHPQIEQDDTLAKDLLIAGADPTILNAKGESYLYKTALRGAEAFDIINIALAHNANVNALTMTKNTIMMDIILAASQTKEDQKRYKAELLHIASRMLKYKGNINALDGQQESGLFNAIRLKDTELIQFLLQAKIDPNIQNKQGETVLEHLIYFGMKYAKIIQLLLEYRIDPTLKNKKGQTIYELLTNLILHKDGEVLIKDKKILEMYDPDGLYINVVQVLLAYEKTFPGNEFILDFYDSTGDPLFFKPLIHNNFALFNLYTKHPINLHMLNKQQHNIFFAYVLRVFEKNEVSPAILANFKNNISSLISRKIDKDFKDSLGWTILHKVISTKCNIRLFRILTEIVRFDYQVTDNLGRTVVHNAVWQNNKEVIKIINTIAPGVINKEDIYGIPPIYYASLLGNKDLVINFFHLDAMITISSKINLKAIKKFKPMLKNLEKLKIDIEDPNLELKITRLIEQIQNRFMVS